jgi:proline dehydrogenase
MIVNRALVSLLRFMPRSLVWRFSRRYIAGTSLDDALRVVRELNSQGMSATLDVLGEDTGSADEVARARDLYLEALAALNAGNYDCNISIKLSQMGLRLDPVLCRQAVARLAEEAAARGNFVRIDMEDSSVTGATLELYRRLRPQLPVGAVIQAMLRRSAGDVQSLLSDGPTHIRLCKGIYREPEEIAFQGREEVRDSYRELLRALFVGGAVKVAIAGHDPPLVEHALGVIAELGVDKSRYEFQMLLGVAEEMRAHLVASGHPLRVYVPFGEAWYPYSMRRLRENPQVAGHIVKNLFVRA